MSDTTTYSQPAQYDETIPAGTPASKAIYETVATLTGTSPLDMEPLGAAVDTIALDTVATTTSVRLDIEFTYETCHIHLHGQDLRVFLPE